ncbi:MAG: hypothetical protein PHW74_09825 [Desulfobacca sp.]|nr:hypothetical protein [Desulfobacca sp.]
MEEVWKLQIMEEIKRIERELYLKKSRLAASEAQEYGPILPPLLGEKAEVDDRIKIFSTLIEEIGLLSSGGNSVEDLRLERQRDQWQHD